MSRRLSRVLAVAAAVLALGGLAVPSATAAPSGASLPAVGPVRVVLSGPVAVVSFQVRTTLPCTPHGMFGVMVDRPTIGFGTVESEAYSATPTVPVGVVAASDTMPLGAEVWTVRDMGPTEGAGSVRVTVLRASRLAVKALTAVGGGRASGAVRVAHYEPGSGTWTGAPSSPVRVEYLKGKGWVLAATWTTDGAGFAGGVVVLPSGVQSVRFVRPDGARDAAVSVVGGPVRVV